MPKIKIPEVSLTRVSIDLDVNPDGHLANVSCLPEFMSNEYAIIYSTEKSKAFCARFYGDAGGVIGRDYTNCITEDGELFSMDDKGNMLKGAIEEKGKARLTSLLAQTYDCYIQQSKPNELAQFFWDIDINNIDVAQLSRLMWKYEPLIETTALPVDIDQDSKNLFPPTVGTVTADPTMVDDVAIIWKPESNIFSDCLEYCFTFVSELLPPYGNSWITCISEDGSVFAPASRIYSSDAHTRLMQNIGNVFNSYFTLSSEFAKEIVANEENLTMPTEPAPAKDMIEEQKGILAELIDTWGKGHRQATENCVANPLGCDMPY